jgi:hypothetical protein
MQEMSTQQELDQPIMLIAHIYIRDGVANDLAAFAGTFKNHAMQQNKDLISYDWIFDQAPSKARSIEIYASLEGVKRHAQLLSENSLELARLRHREDLLASGKPTPELQDALVSRPCAALFGTEP